MASRFALVFLLMISAQRGEFKKPMCPPIASERRLLFTRPSVLREVGGDPLDIRIDGLEHDEVAARNAVCRFFSGDRFVDVPGFINGCHQIYCTTPPFTTISCVPFHVSVDGTKTFPFKGNVYVLSQEDLPAKVEVFQPFLPRGKIDFSREEKIHVTWPWDKLDNVETVSIYIQVVTSGFDRDQTFLWSSEIEIAKHLGNGGSFVFLPSEIPRQSLNTLKQFGLTLGVIRVEADYFFQACSSEYLITMSPGECSDWTNELESGSDNVGNLTACPCTYEQASVDGNFTAISHVDPPCFRSAVGSMGARQECCYSEEGNILNSPFMGGTADAYALGSTAGTILHLWYDVLPSIACCELDNECGTYYKYRASDDCTNYQPPGSAEPVSNCGDPGWLPNGIREGHVFLQGHRVLLSCDRGFYMVGDAELTCQPNGSWIPSLPECKVLDWASWLRLNLQTVIVIVVSIILFTFVVKSSYSLYRKLRTMKESSSGGENDSASSK